VNGRTAVITGGGRGVGAAIAVRLARAGVSVLVASRTASQVQDVAARLRADGHVAHAEMCDVSAQASVEHLASAAAQRLGRVDILINNAGVATAAAVHKTSLEDWDRMFAINATGAFLCLRAFLPGMLERRWGRVVNVASVAGLSADRYMGAYAASKHALMGLTRAAAAESAEHGVTINAVCPGYLATDMTKETIARIVQKTGRSEAQALDALLQMTRQKRLIEADEVAAAVAYLCTDEAHGINGEALVIDGGDLRR
jgi:NAD(P)-dependent dehydrogenase (short-subunit alcohol dehydrogenase family)